MPKAQPEKTKKEPNRLSPAASAEMVRRLVAGDISFQQAASEYKITLSVAYKHFRLARPKLFDADVICFEIRNSLRRKEARNAVVAR